MRQHAVSLAIALATLAAVLQLAAADERGDRAGDAAGRPASTLNRPTTPTAAPDAEGFIRRWLVLEPIPAVGLTQDAVRTAIKTESFPNQFTVIPKDGDSVDVKGSRLTWHAEETTEYNVNLYHFGPLTEEADVQRPVLGRHDRPLPLRDERRPPGHRLQRGLRVVGQWPGSRRHLWRSPDRHR